AIAYVPNAVPVGDGKAGLQPLDLAGSAAHLVLVPRAGRQTQAKPPTSVSLFDQGLTQVLQAPVTGLEPKKPYVLALASKPDGSGALESLSEFMTNPAGSAIVNAVGPIRQLVRGEDAKVKRYLVIVPGTRDHPRAPVQVQASVE